MTDHKTLRFLKILKESQSGEGKNDTIHFDAIQAFLCGIVLAASETEALGGQTLHQKLQGASVRVRVNAKLNLLDEEVPDSQLSPETKADVKFLQAILNRMWDNL